MVISLSARKRDINKKHITMLDFYNLVKKNRYKNIGLMFGKESSGLSNKSDITNLYNSIKKIEHGNSIDNVVNTFPEIKRNFLFLILYFYETY